MTAPPPGLALLGAYRLLAVLGRGGMGEVWSAVHTRTGRAAAVKLLTRAPDDPRWHQAFRDEVSAVAALDHPHVIRILDQGSRPPSAEAPAVPYMVMELASGGTLRDRLADLDAADRRAVLTQTLRALAHVHARGLLHRDVKPSNLLFQRDEAGQERLLLGDFGIARRTEGADDTIVSAGTPAYMAPEQFPGVPWPQGPWTDLYAVGCLAVVLLGGQPPLADRPAEGLALARQQPLPPALLRQLPAAPALQAWLRRLLAPHPVDRFRCAADALHALQAIPLAEPAARPPSPPAGAATATLTAAPSPSRAAQPLPSAWTEVEPPVEPPPPPEAGWQEGTRLRLLWDSESGPALYGLRAVPFVGREAERAALWAHLRAVWQARQPALVALVGPPGVGRSRLARWLVERADEVGAAVVLQAAPGASGEAPLAAMLARALRCRGLEPVARADLLRRRLPTLDAEDQHALALLLDGRLEGGGGPAARALVCRTIQALCLDRPAVVWLDDADGAAGLRALARTLVEQGVPALVVLTAAADGALPRGAERQVLAPLGEVELRQLVRQLLGLAPALAARVERWAGGLPLLAVQVVGDWVSRGLLRETADGLQLSAEDAALPTSVAALGEARLQAGLAALPATARQGVILAAALGRTVRLAEWRACCVHLDGCTADPEAVLHLRAQGLVEAVGPDGEDTWTWAHPLLQEALARRASPDLHAAIAAWLRTDARPERQRELGRLGHHLLAAGQPAEAILPLRIGAARAMESSEGWRTHTLLELHRRALRAAGVPPADWEWGLSRSLEIQIRYVFQEFERFEALLEEQDFDGARYGWDGLRVEVASMRARHLANRGALAEAWQALEAVRPLAEALTDQRLLAGWLRAQAWVLQRRGANAEAEQALLRIVEIAQAESYPPMLAGTWASLSVMLGKQGRLEEAAVLAETTLAYALEHGVMGVAADCANSLGESARGRGELEVAERYYLEAHRIEVRLGSLDAALPQINLGIIALTRRQPAQARALLTEALQTYERIDNTYLASLARAFLLHCALHDSNAEEAAALFQAVGDFLLSSGVADDDFREALQGALRLVPPSWSDLQARLQRLADLQRDRLQPG